MTMTPEEMQKLGNHSVDMAMSSLSSWTKNAQAIALEVADYSQKSFAGTAAAWEKLMDAKSLEKAMEVQGEYLKSRTRILWRKRPRSVSFASILPRTPARRSEMCWPKRR